MDACSINGSIMAQVNLTIFMRLPNQNHCQYFCLYNNMYNIQGLSTACTVDSILPKARNVNLALHLASHKIYIPTHTECRLKLVRQTKINIL